MELINYHISMQTYYIEMVNTLNFCQTAASMTVDMFDECITVIFNLYGDM